MGGVSAAVSKSAAAPIERIKLLMQNQVRLFRFSGPRCAKGETFGTKLKSVSRVRCSSQAVLTTNMVAS